jgi:hypothetical protein
VRLHVPTRVAEVPKKMLQKPIKNDGVSIPNYISQNCNLKFPLIFSSMFMNLLCNVDDKGANDGRINGRE